MRAASRTYYPESSHTWRTRDYEIPAQGVLRVYKPEGMHREQVFSCAVIELRKLIEEMYADE